MKNFRDKPKGFVNEWGDETLKGGYTQIPNELIKNLRTLGLKSSEAVVLLYLLCNGEGRKIRAKTISRDANLSIGTVRSAFRSLEAKNLMSRHLVLGESNRFTRPGLKKRIHEISKNKYSPVQNLDGGMTDYSPDFGQNSPTIKENIKYKKEGFSYPQLQKAKEQLIKRMGL